LIRSMISNAVVMMIIMVGPVKIMMRVKVNHANMETVKNKVTLISVIVMMVIKELIAMTI